MMTTIFIPPEDLQNHQQIRLSKEKSHYLVNVMRHGPGDKIKVIDGCRRAFLAVIEFITNEAVSVYIANELIVDTEPPYKIHLCQGLIKNDKIDFVIQKTTELGVTEITPLITERTVLKDTRKLKRWRKIAEEAAEQCGRAVIPTIHEPVALEKFLSQSVLKNDNQALKGFICWEEGGESLSQAFKKIFSCINIHDIFRIPIYIIVGPEGGLTQSEVKLAEETGLIRITLGKRLLKSETASIAVTAISQFVLDKELITP